MRRADIEVPNGAVDVNSWAPSACYPRGSFYPLSDTPSTRRYQITKPDFRLCSTCWSRSQAPLYLCTLRLVSIQPEGTFGRLRYSLGGDRPSQTTPLTLSSARLVAGVRPYTSAFAFAETCVFAKQSPGPFHSGFDRPLQAAVAKRPFSRSYGAMLPSSLTRVLPIALVCSTRLPVSDCGTDTFSLARHFSCQRGSLESRQKPLSFASRGLE